MTSAKCRWSIPDCSPSGQRSADSKDLSAPKSSEQHLKPRLPLTGLSGKNEGEITSKAAELQSLNRRVAALEKLITR